MPGLLKASLRRSATSTGDKGTYTTKTTESKAAGTKVRSSTKRAKCKKETTSAPKATESRKGKSTERTTSNKMDAGGGETVANLRGFSFKDSDIDKLVEQLMGDPLKVLTTVQLKMKKELEGYLVRQVEKMNKNGNEKAKGLKTQKKTVKKNNDDSSTDDSDSYTDDSTDSLSNRSSDSDSDDSSDDSDSYTNDSSDSYSDTDEDDKKGRNRQKFSMHALKKSQFVPIKKTTAKKKSCSAAAPKKKTTTTNAKTTKTAGRKSLHATTCDSGKKGLGAVAKRRSMN